MRHEPWVMIAEDDDTDVFFIQRAFKEAEIEHPVRLVRDGQEAIDLLESIVANPDPALRPPVLVILDLKMPRRTGIDVLEWIRREPLLRPVPVIVFSSSAHRLDTDRAYELGANAFVVKPASLAKRTEFARMVKAFWLELNLPPLVCTEGLPSARRMLARRTAAPKGV